MKIDSSIISFLIASLGGLIRYANNVYAGSIVFRGSELVMRIGMSGGIGILAGWIAPHITDHANLQHAFTYVAGMISVEIIKTISRSIPSLIDAWVKKNMDV